jgi:Asp/Glu/hydantoin racemase
LIFFLTKFQSITKGLQASLDPIKPAGVTLTYLTGSKSFQCPPSIDGALTSIQSTNGIYQQLKQDQDSIVENAEAILICCFSDHPLVNVLRQEYPSLPCIHILESSINFALSSSSKPFGIITTGVDMIPDIDKGVLSYLGGSSIRYAGCLATNLGVLELRLPESRSKVEGVIRSKVVELGEKGVGAIVLGCAGMAGMEPFIRQCLVTSLGSKRGNQVAIIDGAKAGIHLLAGLTRCELTSAAQ